MRQVLDRDYTYGGADATNGLYTRSQGMAPRLARALSAIRGRWPGGRGRTFGAALGDIAVVTETLTADVRRAVEEAWAEFVSEGEISDVAVEVRQVRGGAIFVATYTDLTIGEPGLIPIRPAE